MPNTSLPESIVVNAGDLVGDAEVAWAEINRLSKTTGLRDITSLLENGWTATGVRIERIVDHVHLYVRGLDGISATGNSFLSMSSLGSGFAPMGNSWRSSVYWDSNAEPNARVTITNANFLGTSGTAWGGQWNLITYRTEQNFPSTFPGTAV